MNAKDRILTALACKIPDRVPYMYSMIDIELQEEMLGHELKDYRFDLTKDPGLIARPGEDVKYSLNYPVHPDTARKLRLDAIGIRFPTPLFCLTQYGRGGHSVERGLLDSRDALGKIKMPDPDDSQIYREAQEFIRKFQGEFALFASIRLGASPTLMSMGYDTFSYALYDDIDFVHEVVDFYTQWTSALVKNISSCGFDFMWAFDDIAYKNGPLFSVSTWNDVFLPRLKKVADNIKCPWIYHSDGNLLPILDAMLPLGMSGIHPLEPGAMDLDLLKAKYGRRLCLVGNIDINHTLSAAAPEEVETPVRERIEQLAPGGGYIISDSNSVPYFCKAENIIAMSKAVRKYCNFYDPNIA